MVVSAFTPPPAVGGVAWIVAASASLLGLVFIQFRGVVDHHGLRIDRGVGAFGAHLEKLPAPVIRCPFTFPRTQL